MKICLTPRVHGTGGMVSFAAKFAAGLHARGIDVSDDLRADDADAVLVIGGTRDLVGLWRARRRGVPVIQRLNGMNWIHRKRRTGFKHYLRAEYGNLLLALIRGRLATGIVYQSAFSQQWWQRVYGATRSPHAVVYNGVDLDTYSPLDSTRGETLRVLMVEASLGGGYEMGLETGVALTEHLAAHFPVELMVVGSVPAALQTAWQSRSKIPIQWAGRVPRERIPAIDRAAHVFYAADLHPACPNAVIEALACGLPVAAFATGALPEIVAGESGRVVSYGSDPWQIGPPDVPALAAAAAEILTDQERFRRAARARAQAAFGLDQMVEGYLTALRHNF